MEIKPTESELEILQVLWAKEACSVRDVHEELSRSKDAGYTTTLKLMQIMLEKGLVERDATNRTHIYKSLVSIEHTRQNMLNKMIDTVFQGSASELVMQVLSNKTSSKEELEMIKDYLDKLDNMK